MNGPLRPLSSPPCPSTRQLAQRRRQPHRAHPQGDFVVELRGRDLAPVGNAHVDYRLKRHSFLFGTAIAHAPFADSGEDGRHYRQFILDHVSGLVCENEMKWYATEVERGHEDYAPADALLAFAEQNGLAMRGHCLFWEKQEFAQSWLAALDQRDLRAAVGRRLASTVTATGRLVAWDEQRGARRIVPTERLGPDATAWMFRRRPARSETPLFVNDAESSRARRPGATWH
jgi:GH35 family endo-1,4-beta-xylanase